MDILTAGEQYLGIEGHGGCTMSEYRGYLLRLLGEIDRICRKNGIEYFLIYGTLIGAVRHNGFIPWDDDADVAMTRDGYNKFRECCASELGEEFDLVSYIDDENYGYLFPKLRMKNTTYIIRSEISRHGRSAGFFVDIIILDYLSENRMKAYIQQRATLALHRLVSPGFYQHTIGLNAAENFLVGASRLLLGRKRAIRLAERIITSQKAEDCSQVIAQIIMRQATAVYVYDKSHFAKGVDVPFESLTLKIPQNSIELLHRCYCKGAAHANVLLENIPDDEQRYITERRLWYFNDIMYIPPDRARDHHLEIVFDKDHPSSYYDEKYFADFDKKKNDRCAVKERASRERARKPLRVMNANETIARADCMSLMLSEYVRSSMQRHPDVGSMTMAEALETSSGICRLNIYHERVLSAEERQYCLRVMLASGYGGVAQRMCQRMAAENPELDISEEQRATENMLEAYYAVFENRSDVIRRYTESNSDFFAYLLGGVLDYMCGNDEKARIRLTECLKMDNSLFIAHYFLGLIAEREGNGEEARQMFTEAINDTSYMPLIQMAIDKLRNYTEQ